MKTDRVSRAGASAWKPPERRSHLRAPVAPAPPGGLGLASESARLRMTEGLQAGGIRDPEVLQAMARVPRHGFVEPALASRAYEDVALPIGHGQSISRPSTVARMLEIVLAPLPTQRRPLARALEIGTGCGYQAALMASLFGEVISIERVRGLHAAARGNLRPLRLGNLRLVFGDGQFGAPDAAPFDAIVVAAAGERIPQELLLQLKPGARLLAPVAESGRQALHLVERVGEQDWSLTILDPVRFVPLRGGTA